MERHFDMRTRTGKEYTLDIPNINYCFFEGICYYTKLSEYIGIVYHEGNHLLVDIIQHPNYLEIQFVPTVEEHHLKLELEHRLFDVDFLKQMRSEHFFDIYKGAIDKLKLIKEL